MRVTAPDFGAPSVSALLPRLIACYLPQFLPTPENDAWWGKGFTEWRNTAKACPLFPGHRQPHVLADLGFHDLRVPETREAQADLARRFGIESFCDYHDWFGAGRQVLERPLQEALPAQPGETVMPTRDEFDRECGFARGS